jgi:enamine deaminase RidA (YjgF/YER057c/UK114 family)
MIEDKLAQVGLSPPAASKPAFAYVPVTLHDGVAYVSGQLPKIDGEVRVFGKVGREVTPDAGARSIGEAFTSLTGDGREGGEW